jgi:hypothetical protein
MNVTISTQILSGNLGDGWDDQNNAADSLAEYTKKVWSEDLKPIFDKHAIDIDIDVQHNTSGSSRDVSVDVDGATDDEVENGDDYELMRQVRDLLTDEQTVWINFCDQAND